MDKEIGTEKTQQLVKYVGVTSLTRSQAMEIMETIWPAAPATDKVAAAILCSSYGLNPLANHVFLIPFLNKKTGKKEWARVWGIKAKRLLASRRGAYSYLDMTPRLMTDEEQVKVWGATDPDNLCYMTHLKDMKTGAEAYGYGKWPKKEQPYGTDKGNSQANMASIRSESQGLDRLRPAEMPGGFAVADERYITDQERTIDVNSCEVIDAPLQGARKGEEAGEVAEQQVAASSPSSPPEVRPVARGEVKADEAWEQLESEAEKPKRDPKSIKTISELYRACHEDFNLQPKEVLKELGYSSQTDIAETPEECYRRINAVREQK